VKPVIVKKMSWNMYESVKNRVILYHHVPFHFHTIGLNVAVPINFFLFFIFYFYIFITKVDPMTNEHC
jgi:hypothetical protein